jgi:transcriptional regulator of arginine metabolism
MRSKQTRHAKIRELLQSQIIGTHEKLAAVLHDQRIEVSQSTLSKDLRELGIVRVPLADGSFRYTLPESGTTRRDHHILERELRDFMVSVERASNLLVVKVLPGRAQSLGAAVDSMEWDEVMGTIGGDDTLLVICSDEARAEELRGRIGALSGEELL